MIKFPFTSRDCNLTLDRNGFSHAGDWQCGHHSQKKRAQSWTFWPRWVCRIRILQIGTGSESVCDQVCVTSRGFYTLWKMLVSCIFHFSTMAPTFLKKWLGTVNGGCLWFLWSWSIFYCHFLMNNGCHLWKLEKAWKFLFYCFCCCMVYFAG